MEQSWRFRQLEATTRALATLEHLQVKVESLDAAAASYAAAVQQQHDDQHSELEQQLSRLGEWAATTEGLSETGSRFNTALVHMAQQWVAKQQKLRSSDKGMQVSTGAWCTQLTACLSAAPGCVRDYK
jgi:ABC-type transporter Mla subunit MlaD